MAARRLVQPKDGPVLAFYSTDGRLRREVEMHPRLALRYFTNQGTPPGVFNLDLEASALEAAETAARRAPPERAVGGQPRQPLSIPRKPKTCAASGPIVSRPVARATASGGASFIGTARSRPTAAATARSKTCGAMRSTPQQLDWLGNGDHDNGGGKEYTWWLIQKTTDMYTALPRFVPMFTYERSVSYPHGHRNVMFDHRGVRTLPRLVGPGGVVDEDTLMLYNYLKEHNGICASHTSATGMGTDWRDVNPKFEPFVEIYQGHRQSYEYLGRRVRPAGRPNRSAAGSPWEWCGMLWPCNTGWASRRRATISRLISAMRSRSSLTRRARPLWTHFATAIATPPRTTSSWTCARAIT